MLHQSELNIEYEYVESLDALNHAVNALASGSGPIAVDAERAAGFRYSHDAYLVQVSRAESGTFLVDPTAFDTLEPLAEVMNPEVWILHAASQDLPSLSELGLMPANLVDTELAGRLLGFPRVGLGSLAEHYLEIILEKAHSAVDWSKRPLPADWLEYAALDAALLPRLWELVEKDLIRTGKRDFARQEFEHVRIKPPKEKPAEPWRRLSGIHQLRGTRELAIARELWNARDALARELDVTPTALIYDRSIVFAAKYVPRSAEDLDKQRGFRGKASSSEIDRWWRAIRRGKLTDELPEPKRRDPHSIPHQSTWSTKRPEAADRLTQARAAVSQKAQELEMPVENLLTPSVLRHLAWEPVLPITIESVGAQLRELGARDWQIEQTQQVIADAFVDPIQN